MAPQIEHEVPPDAPRRLYCGPYLSFATLCLLAGEQSAAVKWMSRDSSLACMPIIGSLRLRKRDGAIEYVDAGDLALRKFVGDSDRPWFQSRQGNASQSA